VASRHPPNTPFSFSFFLVFFYFLIKKNDTWQGYYRHISTKLAFFKLFGSLEAKVQALAVHEATCKTASSLGG